MAQQKEEKKPRTRFQKTVQWVTLLILISFVTGSIIVGGLSFRSSQNVKTPPAANPSEAQNVNDKLSEWEQAAKLNPKDPFTLRSLAKAQMKAGKFKDAGKTLQAASAVSPKDPLTIELTGQFYLARGQGKEAVEQFKKVIATEPDDAIVNYELALAYVLYGDERSALHYYQVVLDKGGQSRAAMSARMAMLDIYRRQGNFSKAEQIGRSLDSIMPGNPQVLSILMDVLEHEKKWNDAISYARQLQRLDPKNADNSAALARLYAQSGNWTEAGKTWADLISQNPNNASYKYELAIVDKKNGKASEAKDLLQRAKQEASEEQDKDLEQKIDAESRGM